MIEYSKILRVFCDLDPSLPWDSRRSIGAPDTVEDLLQFDVLELGHVTSSVFLDSIRNSGVLPNGITGNRYADGLASAPDFVYLMSRYDSLYSERAVSEFGGEAVVMTVRVERKFLEADSNALAEARKFTSKDEALFHTLCFGACAHMGAIPAPMITGARFLDGRNAW